MNDAAFVLEKNAFCYILGNTENSSHEHHHDELHQHEHDNKTLNYHVFRARFLNSNINTQIRVSNPEKSIINYFLGNNPDKWATGIQSFSTISYMQLYKGIDMYVNTIGDEFIKYDFIVALNINTSVINIKYDGIDSIWLNDGDLMIQTSVGKIMEQKPIAFQVVNNKRVIVKCNFKLYDNKVSFVFPMATTKMIRL